MTYSFHPHAEAELNASVDYYEECQTDLGLEFAHEANALVLESPLLGVKITKI